MDKEVADFVTLVVEDHNKKLQNIGETFEELQKELDTAKVLQAKLKTILKEEK